MDDFSQLFRSTEEQVTPLAATVKGTIPDWLNGTLVRLGPGKFDLADGFVLNHWFDGYAVLINFTIENGKVTFLKKFLQSEAFKKAMTVGKPVFIEYGTKSFPDPTKTFFSKLKSAILPELTDSDGINIFRIEDSVFVATETNYIHRIDPYTLETKEKVDLGKIVPITWTSSHHYRVDNEDSWTVGTTMTSSGIQHHIVKIPVVDDRSAKTAFQKASVLTSVVPAWKTNTSYYHSFGISKNYIVFIEQPMIMNGMKILTVKMKSRSLRDCMDWSPEELNRFIIVNKNTGEVLPIKIKSKSAFFFLHHINTFEKDGHIVIDVVAHDSPEVVDKLFLDKLRNSEVSQKDLATARRFVIPLCGNDQDLPQNQNLVKLESKATAVIKEGMMQLTHEELGEGTGFELPTVNPVNFGKPYRYFG